MKAPLHPFLQTETLRLYRRPGTGPYLLVVFSGVGRDHALWPDPEFVHFARENPQHHVIFVCERGRSWLNAPGLIETLEHEIAAYRSAHGTTRTVTIGNSMGGFMAIAMAGRIGARSALAIAPQWSMHPEIVPSERRWRKLRAAIKFWRVPDLAESFCEHTLFFVLHGAKPMERCHWEPMPRRANIQHYIFPELSHFVVRPLRNEGFLHPLIASAMALRPRRVRTMVEAGGGLKRIHYDRHIALPASDTTKEF